MTRSKKLVFSLVLIAILGSLAEGAGRFLITHVFPAWEHARKQLLGDRAFFQRAMGQSFLNYVGAPGFANPFGVQHNADGYRGKAVPVERAAGDVVRILCLGGSTTYGWSVHYPQESYPAQLEKILNERLAADPATAGRRVEVMNGGLPWGTSAEMLTHYHFKYHYYRPDLVVFHGGINDAQAFDLPEYQPDYGHSRQQMPQPLVLPPPMSWLVHSRFLSLFIVPALLGLHPEMPTFVKMPPNAIPDIHWYDEKKLDREHPDSVPMDQIAYAHNIESLIAEVQADGAIAAVMPDVFSPQAYTDPDIKKWLVESHNSIRYTERNAKILRELATKTSAVFVPFSTEHIKRENWFDAMHLDAVGEHEKATQAAAVLEAIVKRPHHAVP